MDEETNSSISHQTFCLPDSNVADKVNMMDSSDNMRNNINRGNPPFLPKSRVSLDAGSSCPVCGSDMVTIRGKYTNSTKRVVCPACLADCIDAISEIIDRKK